MKKEKALLLMKEGLFAIYSACNYWSYSAFSLWYCFASASPSNSAS